jgi:hypothetical protein
LQNRTQKERQKKKRQLREDMEEYIFHSDSYISDEGTSDAE